MDSRMSSAWLWLVFRAASTRTRFGIVPVHAVAGWPATAGSFWLSVASSAQPRTAPHDRWRITARQTRRAEREWSVRIAGSARIFIRE